MILIELKDRQCLSLFIMKKGSVEMKQGAGNLKSLVVYVLISVMLLSILAFPNIVYGDDRMDVDSLGYIALYAANGKYVCAEDGGGSKVVVNRDKADIWETFEVIKIDRNTIALKTSNGRYLYLEDEKKGSINAKADKIYDEAKFVIYNLGNNKVALKANNGRYVALEEGDQLAATHKKVNNESTFKILKMEDTDTNGDKCILSAVVKDKSVYFTWTKPRDTKNIIGYNLYRGTASGKESKTPITDFPIEGRSYTDKNVEADTTYYYILRPVYKDKTLGAASNEVKVVISPQITLSAKAGEDGIELTWNKPRNSSNIIGYNLYRGRASGKVSETPITDFPIEKTSYIDKNIENNTTYYYILRAVYRDKTLGSPSNEVAVKSNLYKKVIVLEVGSKYMYVDGQRKEIDPGKNTAVIIKNGRTFLPIKAVIEAMGGEVEWEPRNQKVTIYHRKDKIELWIGSKTAKVNGTMKETDVAPYVSENNRTMLPLRFIVENLNCEVDWDGITKKVTIKAK